MPEISYTMVGNAIAVLGGVVLLFALFSDSLRQRFKRRRRCPKCWYDLSHSPTMTCSECGNAAKDDRKLYKGRRRWRFAWLAVLLVVTGYGVCATPGIKERGWVAAVPTTVLIAVLPWLEPDLEVWETNRGFGLRGKFLPKADWRNQLFSDFAYSRVDEHDLWSWQETLLRIVCRAQDTGPKPQVAEWDNLTDQVLGSMRWANGRSPQWYDFDMSQQLPIEVVSRRIWPVGLDVWAMIELKGDPRPPDHRLVGQPISEGLNPFEDEQITLSCGTGFPPPLWSDELKCLGRHESSDLIRYRIKIKDQRLCSSPWTSRWLTVQDEIVEISVERSNSIDELLTPVHSPAFDRALRKKLNPHLHYGWFLFEDEQEYGLSLGLSDEEMANLLGFIPGATFAFRVDVLVEDQVMARGEAWFKRQDYDDRFSVRPYLYRVPLRVFEGIDIAGLTKSNSVQVRFVGDPEVALRNFDCDRYWEGVVTVPLVVGQDSDWYP